MKGFFISIEGGEGSGKTTVIAALKDYFLNKGMSVCTSREPGGIKIAEDIRKIILDVNNTKMTKETETLLYAAARAQHLAEKIIPALEKGEVVILDRYLDSSLVYQGLTRGVGIENVLNANYFALNWMPNLTIFLDVSPEIGLKRIQTRGKLDRLDLEDISFHRGVYEGYQKICKMYKKRIVKINGEQNKDDVIRDIIEVVEKRFKG